MRPVTRSITAAMIAVTALIANSCSGDEASGPDDSPHDGSLSVTISPKLDTLRVGSSKQLTARVQDARRQPVGTAIAWHSVDPAVASVSATGVVTAMTPGTTSVIAAAGSGADSATLVVLPAAASISISPGAMQVVLGDSLSLVASARSPDGTLTSRLPAQWSSSDPGIATVSADGVVTTVDAGEATISAQLNGASASAALQVVKTSVASITVAPGNSTISPGQTQQLVATLFDGAGRAIVSPSLKWTSDDTTKARVSESGLVTGVARGTAIIRAQASGKRASATVNVTDVPVATVEVSLAAATLSVGQTTQATATLRDAAGNTLPGRVIAWQSSNPAVATVHASGLVTAIANGSATISAISDAKVGSAPLRVAAPVPTSVAIAPSSISLVAGQVARLAAEVRDANGALIPNWPVKWSTAHSGIATVTSGGELTAVAVGSTSVQATSDGLTASAQVVVTEVKAASVTVTPDRVSLVVGNNLQLAAAVQDARGAALPDRPVNWWSSNPAVATVAPNGVVTAISSGDATINAEVDGIRSASLATVAAPPPAPVASVGVALTSASLNAGQTTQAVATLRDAAGSVLSDRPVSWSSTNAEVVTVSPEGLVTAVGPGSASVVATSEGQSGAATVTVAPPQPSPVASVSLSASNATLMVGQSIQLAVKLEDASGNVLSGRTIGWTSSNTTVATVSPSGVVTAVGVGTVTIGAASEGKEGSITLSVVAPPPAPVAVVAVTLSAASLKVGATAQAMATLTDASGNVLTGRALAWSSSSTAVASVNASGLVTAVGVGTATIVATSEGRSGSAAMTVVSATPPPPPAGPLPAVPGLVSFGAQTPAGRGGQVIRVTNLNDAGAGSLRAALAAAGPRTVVFEVSGNIRLASRINVLNPYVTVAGQTAPAPGVAVVGEGITIRTHDVLFQHFRVRPGDGPCCDPENRDAIEILGRTGQSGAASGYNVVMDHMSFSWAVDEVASTWWGPLRDVTFADCIIAEGLRVSLKGFNHSKGLLVGDSTRNIATLRTLIAHNYDRSPYLKGYSATVFANNLVYNYAGSPAASVGDPEGSGPTQAAIVGNVFVRGLESGTGRPIGLFGSTKPGSQIYVADNAPGRASAPPADPWSLVSNSAGAGVVAAQPPLWPAGFQAMPSGRVYDHVLASAGAWPAARDAADARVVADARDGTGRGIDSPAQVGGFPALAQQRRTMEQAGMPAAPGADSDGDGYTDLEEWLHALARAAEGR